MKKDKQKNITPYENMTIDEMTALAEQGDKLVQNDIGICYLIGVGVEKDLQKAIEWFTKSAKQGDKEARNNLNDLKHSLDYFNLRYF